MIPRFSHILVPLDFTPKNRAALEIALEIAVDNRARVTLLHVIEVIENLGDNDLADFYQRLQTRADSELESRAQPFSDAALDVEQKVRYGKRAEEIVTYAADRDVDLIIMSSHAIDPEQPAAGWATLSYQVSVLCQCPVLLVK